MHLVQESRCHLVGDQYIVSIEVFSVEKIVVINWYNMSKIVISMNDQYDKSMQEKNEHM